MLAAYWPVINIGFNSYIHFCEVHRITNVHSRQVTVLEYIGLEYPIIFKKRLKIKLYTLKENER